MKNKFRSGVGALLSFGIALNALAAPTLNPSKQKPTATPSQKSKPVAVVARKETPVDQKKFLIFGGLDLGMALYSETGQQSDGPRSGFDFGVRGLVAYYLDSWVIDGGLGFLFISSSGTNYKPTPERISSSVRTVFFDLSPRYRLDEHWQIGPELQFWTTSDYGLNRDLNLRDSNNALMAGVQTMYEWGAEKKYRVGARWNMDLNASDRDLHVIQGFFQMSFSGFGSKDQTNPYLEEMRESDVEKAEDLPDPEPVVLPTPAPEQSAVPTQAGPQEKMVVTLDVNELPFESDSARLPKYTRDRVQEIGRFLGEHKEDWTSLIVSGHTDEQGNKKYNQKLSKARADTVRQLLGEGGAPLSKIKSVGMGSTRPLDRRHNKEAWAKNRRVELEFKGVKDGLVIQNAFKK
jgi:outer membrane protein OmpA-like peptidoglycan-associated protein